MVMTTLMMTTVMIMMVMMMEIQKVTMILNNFKSDISHNSMLDILLEKMITPSQSTKVIQEKELTLKQLLHFQIVTDQMAQPKLTAEKLRLFQFAKITPSQSLDQDKAIQLAELFQNAMAQMVHQKKTAGLLKVVWSRDTLCHH